MQRRIESIKLYFDGLERLDKCLSILDLYHNQVELALQIEVSSNLYFGMMV